ncbi:MAG: hypothetical protein Q8M76_13235, partial [Spirochaetaceae bacterium]|nr:hypothetical protein [Spirochaetaceae bacterium]
MTMRTRAAVLIAAAAILGGCATIPPPANAPEPSPVKAMTPGFSPTGAEDARAMRLELSFGAPAAVQAWSLAIASGSVIVAERSGVPPLSQDNETYQASADAASNGLVIASVDEKGRMIVEWNGRNAAGTPWPEGDYFAMFSVNYGDTYSASPVSWAPFTLTSGPPTVSLTATPPAFTPAGKGMSEPVTIGVESSSPYASMAGWTIEVLDPRGLVVRGFEGKGSLGAAVWDGLTSEG